MTKPYCFTGETPPGWDGSPVVLTDTFGFTLTLTGRLNSRGGLSLVGRNGVVPSEFKVPWLDDDGEPKK